MPILIKTFHVDLFFWKLDVFSASKTSIKIGSVSPIFFGGAAMSFNSSTYVNFVSAASPAQERLFLQYLGHRSDFDIIIIGSGIGGGVLADDLAERLGKHKRILVLEAGSFLYPTHVYNVCRFPNASLAKHFGCGTFWQSGNEQSQNYIGEQPQLNFGGRSIFWSGLIPSIQGWELEFFPDGSGRICRAVCWRERARR